VNITESSYNLIPTFEPPDQDKPLSFQVWKNGFEVIIPEQAYTQYNEYLINWYKNKNVSRNDLSTQIKINFLNLLKQIQVYFTEEEKESWYAGIDVDNEKEVLLAIPYFARKLKNISLYYLRLREQVKRSKIKYNLTGSNRSVIKQIQDIIIQDYTKKENGIVSLPSSLWAHLPQLSSIKNNIVFEIEELYDTSSYFDRSINLPASAYFPLEQETEKYFSNKGINLSSIDWVYRLGTFTLSSLNDKNLQGTTDPALSSLYFDLAQKYLGRDFYSSLIVQSSAKKDFFDINIQPGNNFFYYPFGPYKTNVLNITRYKPVPLSSTSLQTLGTAGSSLETADTIFVKTKKGIEGAWFRKKVFDTVNTNMKATLEGSSSTIFRFPYPGYGISAEDISWTGYGLVTDPRYFYLDEKTKKGIEEVYWNTSFNLSGIVPININSTSLVENGAYSSSDFNTADKIRVWPIPPQYTDASYTGTVNEAWLYKFKQTNISIGAGTDNTIVWPYYKAFVGKSNYTLPDLPSNICLPEKISDLNLPFATCSNHLSSADVIYKINNITDDIGAAVECAWLSGSNYYYPEKHTFGPKQTHFSTVFKPGTFTPFVWDANTTNINDILNKSVVHSPDCKFVTTPNTTYKDYNLCTCKLVNFVPFGHPGDNFFDNNSLCDYIVEDVELTPLSSVDISMWLDNEGNPFSVSPNAAWFKTNRNIGWGDGTWYSGASSVDNIFFLKRGKRYFYYRANVKNTNKQNNSFPDYIVREQISTNDVSSKVWVNAILNDRGQWISTGKPSNMSINSNDFLIYSRTSSTYFTITSNSVQEIELAENRGSIWSTFDYITVKHPTNLVTISYPTLYSKSVPISDTNSSDPYKQYPNVPFNGVIRVLQWDVTHKETNKKESFRNSAVASFTPFLTGTYTVAMTAITSIQTSLFSPAATGCYYFSNIPPITCIPSTIDVPLLSTFNTPIPGFVLQTNLRGWNYTLNKPSSLREGNTGAKPLWVKSNIDKTIATDYKSVESWSPALTFVDNFNPISFYDPSDIVLAGGEYIEYKRSPQLKIIWDQNLTVNNTVNTNQWCKLETTTNTTQNAFTPANVIVSNPSTTPSTILLQNVFENDLVEIYYNAQNFFVWSITAEPQISETIYSSLISSVAITSQDPWTSYTNQFNPTVAFFPSFDSLVNTKQIGEYFKPKNLGLLTYVNKDYTFELQLSSLQATEIYGAPSQKINNRGLSKEAQFSPFVITQNDNTWLKEPYTTGSLAGTVKKDIFRKYQKFIPYQSSYESNPLTRIGLITPVSRQHPWGGPENKNWVDSSNQPINFTGEISVSHWVKDQVLKNVDLQLYNWNSDIYGNQYGLYKNIKNLSPSQKNTTPGQLWVRKNSQQTEPGYTALLNVFDTYKTLNLYHELTGFGINKIDVFNDTLFIETSSALVFEKINYDYNTGDLSSIVDLARSISLAVPIQNNLNREFTKSLSDNPNYAVPGDTWFFAKEKTIIISVTELSGGNVVPNLFSYDLNKNDLKKVFTIPSSEQTFNHLNIIEVSRPVISYCTTKKEFLYTFTAKTQENKNIVITIHINKNTELQLTDIKVYTPQQPETLPPTLLSDLNLTLLVSSIYTQQISASPLNCTFEPINFPSWANLSNSGLFTCTTPQTPQTFYLPFKVTNSVGSMYSGLNITIQQAPNLVRINNNNLIRINGTNLIRIGLE